MTQIDIKCTKMFWKALLSCVWTTRNSANRKSPISSLDRTLWTDAVMDNILMNSSTTVNSTIIIQKL